MDSYTLNGAENLQLNIEVKNDGEHAYNAVLTVDIPEDVSLVRLHQKQTTVSWQEYHVELSGRNRLEVFLGNPMSAKSSVSFKL